MLEAKDESDVVQSHIGAGEQVFDVGDLAVPYFGLGRVAEVFSEASFELASRAVCGFGQLVDADADAVCVAQDADCSRHQRIIDCEGVGGLAEDGVGGFDQLLGGQIRLAV